MTSPYIKAKMKELRKALRKYRAKDDKVAALHAFEIGLREAIHEAYPNRFPKVEDEVANSQFYWPYRVGKDIAGDLDSLAVEEVSERVLREVATTRQKIENSVWKRANDFLEGLYRLCGQVPRI